MVKIGIGLPSTIVGASRELLIEWARRADSCGFSSLGLIDRIAYPNYEVMATLGAAAAVTRTIRLMPAVLLGPTRSTGLLAKQAATVDALSNGRLTLGLGIGVHAEDFEAAGVPYRTRARRLEEMLPLLRQAWARQPIRHRGRIFEVDLPAMGPRPAQQPGIPIWMGPMPIGRWNAPRA